MADDDCDDCGLRSPPKGEQITLKGTEYLLYQAGQRQGHADALKNEAANMDRLAQWISESRGASLTAASMLSKHAAQAREHSDAARGDSAALLDQALARRSRWRVFVTRLRAAWQTLWLGAPRDAV